MENTNGKIETIYTIISKDSEITRLTNFLFDEYIKIITYILTTDNKKLIYQSLQTFLIAHKSLCEANTYIVYIEKMHTNNIECLKMLHRYKKIYDETILIYQDLEKRLSKSICHSIRDKEKYIFQCFKQILLYQQVIQNYYKEIAADDKLIEDLIY